MIRTPLSTKVLKEFEGLSINPINESKIKKNIPQTNRWKRISNSKDHVVGVRFGFENSLESIPKILAQTLSEGREKTRREMR
jgi:hypothetical protein